MNKRIYLSPPHMSGKEEMYIGDAFDKNWITTSGDNIDMFEKAISEYAGISHSLAVNSGTSALHLALLAINLQPGDEVICSSLTFAATAYPILYCNAKPVFVESEADTWNMSPYFLETAIKARLSDGKKVKAIIVVHLFGNPARMDAIMDIANAYQIPVIEDAAESMGATYKEQMTGTMGEVGVYSFNGNKIITTSGGGALITGNEDIYRKAKHLASQARESVPYYFHKEIGYNYRMSNILAGVGRGQLEVLNERVKARKRNFTLYKELLSTIENVGFQIEPQDGCSNRWLSVIQIKGISSQKDKIISALEAENIESRPVWKPLHTQPVFSHLPYYGDRFSEILFSSGICLPSGSALSEEEVQFISEKIKQTF